MSWKKHRPWKKKYFNKKLRKILLIEYYRQLNCISCLNVLTTWCEKVLWKATSRTDELKKHATMRFLLQLIFPPDSLYNTDNKCLKVSLYNAHIRLNPDPLKASPEDSCASAKQKLNVQCSIIKYSIIFIIMISGIVSDSKKEKKN